MAGGRYVCFVFLDVLAPQNLSDLSLPTEDDNLVGDVEMADWK